MKRAKLAWLTAAGAPQLSELNWEKRSDWVNVKTDVTPAVNRKMTRETALALLPLVEKSRQPELRRLGFRLAADFGDVEITRKLGALVVALATGADIADVRFALGRAVELGPADQAKVVAAAESHADPEIRCLAGCLKRQPRGSAP